MTDPVDVPEQIRAAMALAHAGERDEAAELFTRIWSRLDDGTQLVQRLTVAHALADLQSDPRDELAWDLLALGIADRLSDADLAEAGVGVPVRSLYPSLHLNAGEAYRKVGNLDAARAQCGQGRAALAALGSDPYGGMLTDGFSRLQARIEDDAAATRPYSGPMPAYVIAETDVHDAEQYEHYKAAAPATIAAYGGRYVARGGALSVLEGDWDPARLVILEFDDLAAATRWYESPEYQEARKLREGAATFRVVAVEGS